MLRNPFGMRADKPLFIQLILDAGQILFRFSVIAGQNIQRLICHPLTFFPDSAAAFFDDAAFISRSASQ